MADDPRKQQGQEQKPEAHISFFVRNEAAGKAMARRKVIDRNNEEHEAVTMSWNWRDTWQQEHKRAFVVAKMAKADMLTEVHDSLQKALDEGKPFEEWQKEIVPKLEGKWLGKSVGQLWDELSDEEKAKREPPSEKQREKIIAPERLELIFRTNMAVANAAGHYEQLMKTKAIYPYWRYVTRHDARVRDSHRDLHNKVFKWDDPFWETYFPPNGFRCRCHVSPLTKRQVERDPKLHIEQSNITEDADGRKVLDVGGRYYKNNPGWDYNPGDSVNHLVSLAKDSKKGRPAQVQADLEADLAKKEAEEAAAAKAKAEAEEKRKAEEARRAAEAEKQRQAAEAEKARLERERQAAEAEKARLERERQAKEAEKRLQEAQAKAEQRRAEREAKKAETEHLEVKEKSKEADKAYADAQTANKIVKDLHLDQPDKLKQSCTLEHTIAKREHALIEEELAKAEKSGVDKNKIDDLRVRAKAILSNSEANLNGVGTDKDGDILAISTRHTTQREQNSLLKGVHKEAFDLRISQLPVARQKEEREKRKAVLQNRRNIKIANRNILFADKKNPTEEELYNARVMQREFDLMLYNFSPQKLAFYSDYCQRYVDKNDYLYEDHLDPAAPYSHHDSATRICHIKFRTDRTARYPDYKPIFAWDCKFHEELHQIDDLVGNDTLGRLTGKTNKGDALQKAIAKDIKAFINLSRTQLYNHLEELAKQQPSLRKDSLFQYLNLRVGFPAHSITKSDEASSAAAYYHIAAMYNSDNQDTLESVTDLMGICSRGNLGRYNVARYGRKTYSDAAGKPLRDIYSQYTAHEDNYNTTKAKYAAENAEAWSEIIAAELRGDRDTSKINQLYLPNTTKEINNLLDMVLSLHASNKLIWRY